MNWILNFLILLLFLFSITGCKNDATLANDSPDGNADDDRVNEYFVSSQGKDDNPGSKEKPFHTIQYVLKKLEPGKTLTLLEGTYPLKEKIILNLRGTQDKWITFRGDSGVSVILDGSDYNIDRGTGYPGNNGLIQIEKASYIRIMNIKVQNSHRSGINIQDSDHIDIIDCTTENSLSPGIAAWQRCEYIRILGNTVVNASDMQMSWTPFTGREAPHEAISVAGPHFFEVAWNHVYNCQKEGIDIKETTSHGSVHHNYVHHCKRQGLYIDGWFGQLEDIDMYQNVVHDCEAGIAISSEEGPNTRDLRIHHNVVYNNRATGIFFSRWGADNPRENIEVYNNTFYQNGKGYYVNPNYWLMGGCYLFTKNLNNVIIRNNIFAFDQPFEIGYSQIYGDTFFTTNNILIDYNLIWNINSPGYPFYMSAWAKDSVYTTNGIYAIETDPLFVDPANGDFRLQSNSPAIDQGHPDSSYNDGDESRNDLGAFPLGTNISDFWWHEDFPPIIDLKEL